MINVSVLLVGLFVSTLCAVFLTVTTRELQRLGREADARATRRALEAGAALMPAAVPVSGTRPAVRVTPSGKRLRVA